MSQIIWDSTGTRFYETGLDRGVLYLKDQGTTYNKGYAWNGLITVTEKPSGAEPTSKYADNIKYATLRSAEEFGATIEAYTYPDEFAACDGSVVSNGAIIGQQPRKMFAMSYRTKIGNDQEGESHAYKLHIIYNCTASPSEKSFQTINDSPDAITFSWEITTDPISMGSSYKPASYIIIDSRKAKKNKLEALEKILYGSNDAEPRLPDPEEVLTLLGQD